VGGPVTVALGARSTPPPAARKLYCRDGLYLCPSPRSFINSVRTAVARQAKIVLMNERCLPTHSPTTHWRPFTKFLTTAFYTRTHEPADGQTDGQTDRRPRRPTRTTKTTTRRTGSTDAGWCCPVKTQFASLDRVESIVRAWAYVAY